VQDLTDVHNFFLFEIGIAFAVYANSQKPLEGGLNFMLRSSYFFCSLLRASQI
jgi:hypothetical protein